MWSSGATLLALLLVSVRPALGDACVLTGGSLYQLKGTSNNTRFRRFLPWLSGRLQRSCRGESPMGDRFDAWPASAQSFARCHMDSTRERTQAGAAAIRSS